MSNVSTLATPHLRTVTAVLPQPVRSLPALPAIAEGVLRLPEGAVVAPWPQAGLPAELSGMVGYLVLVPAEPEMPVAPVTAAAGPVAAVTPLRSVSGGI